MDCRILAGQNGQMTDPQNLVDLQAALNWSNPGAIFGFVRARAHDLPFRLRRLQMPPAASDDFLSLCRRSLGRPNLELVDVTSEAAGQWFLGLVQRLHLVEDQVPEEFLTESTRRPIAVAVPVGIEDIGAVFLFRMNSAINARPGRIRLTLFTGAEGVTETHLSTADEAEWQVDESLIAIHLANRDPIVLVEPTGEEASALATLFDELDPVGRQESGRAVAQLAAASIAQTDERRIRFSERAANGLAAQAAANLQFAGRLERALRLNRWRQLTRARIRAVLANGNGDRWGVADDEVQTRDGVLELDVAPNTALRIVRDAFAQSLLNEQDVIEGEGRPAERPDIV